MSTSLEMALGTNLARIAGGFRLRADPPTRTPRALTQAQWMALGPNVARLAETIKLPSSTAVARAA